MRIVSPAEGADSPLKQVTKTSCNTLRISLLSRLKFFFFDTASLNDHLKGGRILDDTTLTDLPTIVCGCGEWID